MRRRRLLWFHRSYIGDKMLYKNGQIGTSEIENNLGTIELSQPWRTQDWAISKRRKKSVIIIKV